MRILLAMALLSTLTGCVGLAVGSFGTLEAKKTDFSLNDQRGKLGFSVKEAETYTTEQVVELWGDPDSVAEKGNCTVYSYHDGLSWSGVGAFVGVVPLPLLVPSGKDETKIYFVDGRSVAAVSEYGEVTHAFGYVCGSNECGFNYGAANTEALKNAEVTECSEI
ncbi:hypothetical protein [Ferrimonas lipolytica]|uniref:Lipoprotein n=1 Tax=Ferrimonas lipolytica TaxID=2724191 RepID=A0A6H1UEN0_9GAMM|nr:hypothetical protein [Ferrimonas lipolytica]QIZ77541.1 hypothetical protein HER31_11955 [Ferrimonas lipolytica]